MQNSLSVPHVSGASLESLEAQAIQVMVSSAVGESSELHDAAKAYTLLGSIATNIFQKKMATRIRIPLDVISKVLKSHGASNFALRRLTDLDSKQFARLSEILRSLFGLGVYPISTDCLLFVKLESPRDYTVTLHDVETGATQASGG